MKLGLLSESHGDVAITQTAITKLLNESVEAILHCGDLETEAVLIEMIALCHAPAIPIYAVLGNVDLWNNALKDFPQDELLQVARRIDLNLAGHSIRIIHGDDTMRLSQSIESDRFNFIFTGHTHRANDETIGNTRVINPGALTRASLLSCATLDLSSGELNYIKL